MEFVPRHVEGRLRRALEAARVVVLHGARQSGKTTLARALAHSEGGAYVSLDDAAIRDAAEADPHTFVHAFGHPLIIDEVQNVGQRLVEAIKMAVDVDPTPGRFVLTGSTNFLTVPNISESLAGRAILLRLWPLSMAEIAGVPPGAALRNWFGEGPSGPTMSPDAETRHAQSPPSTPPSGATRPASPPAQTTSSSTTRSEYLELVCRGGYPEVQRMSGGARQDWFASYSETVIARDILQLGDVRRATLLTDLLRLAAANTADVVNVTRWAQRLGADRATITAYLGWLHTVFLADQLPAWSRSHGARVTRRPKLHLADTGLAAALTGMSAPVLAAPTSTMAGRLLESFVVGEVARQLSAGEPSARLYHYRDSGGREVDLVCEHADGAIVAIEIKATASPRAKDATHLRALRDTLDRAEPGAFRAGILLHTGPHQASFGNRIQAAPIDILWNHQPWQPDQEGP